MARRRVIAVIGSGDGISDEVVAMAEGVGRVAIDHGFRFVTGGLGGVMAAASRGARDSARYREGDVLGILPGSSHADANEWVDVVLPSGLGIARNVLVVRSADAVVVVGGSAGTLSEMALAWQLGLPIIALVPSGGWASELAGRTIDDRHARPVVGANTPEEAIAAVRRALGE